MTKACKREPMYLKDNTVKVYLPDAKPDAIWVDILLKLAVLVASSIAETLIEKKRYLKG